MDDDNQWLELGVKTGCVALAALAGGVMLLFLPLLLSGIEQAFFGTLHVESAFRQWGLHDALRRIYRPLVDALRWLLNLV